MSTPGNFDKPLFPPVLPHGVFHQPVIRPVLPTVPHQQHGVVWARRTFFFVPHAALVKSPAAAGIDAHYQRTELCHGLLQFGFVVLHRDRVLHGDFDGLEVLLVALSLFLLVSVFLFSDNPVLIDVVQHLRRPASHAAGVGDAVDYVLFAEGYQFVVLPEVKSFQETYL